MWHHIKSILQVIVLVTALLVSFCMARYYILVHHLEPFSCVSESESFLIGTPAILSYVHLFFRKWTMATPSYTAPLTQTYKDSEYIRNWAAKLINCALKKDHATPYLREMHWLPVRERIIFKILVRSASDSTRLFQHIKHNSQPPDSFKSDIFHRCNTDMKLSCHLYQKFAIIGYLQQSTQT